MEFQVGDFRSSNSIHKMLRRPPPIICVITFNHKCKRSYHLTKKSFRVSRNFTKYQTHSMSPHSMGGISTSNIVWEDINVIKRDYPKFNLEDKVDSNGGRKVMVVKGSLGELTTNVKEIIGK